jgi:transposase
MANTRLSMRKITEVLRLHIECWRSRRDIARAIGASPTTVGQYLSRAQVAGLGYPLPADMDEARLEALLFPPAAPSIHRRPEPDWPPIHTALRRKGVTLDLLWQEYKSAQPDGLQYSAFCEHYRAWRQRLSVTLRQTHAPGEKLFVDYAGPTVPIIDGSTGEIRHAQVFVAVLGASNYTYIEATWSQQLPDWIGSHVRALTYFGGAPEILVPDNLKSGVKSVCYYEPDLNPTYQDLANHYGIAVLPARPRKPRDKAKVEGGVLVVERWVLARLRNQRYFSLNELNRALHELLTALNQRSFKKLPGCRASAFAELDQPALKPLPAEPYVFAEWKTARVGIDYHVEADGHYYSAPWRHAREEVQVRLTASTVEVFRRGSRIASHLRSTLKGRHTTVDAHMPPEHQAVTGWSPERFLAWAAKIGPRTETAIHQVLYGRRHPQQSYRACMGILRLAKEYGDARLEAACDRALRFKTVSWKSLNSILRHGLDRAQAANPAQGTLPLHDNVRGADYYGKAGSEPTSTVH